MALFKDIYTPDFYRQFTGTLQEILPRFDRENFIKDIFIPAFADMEFKERMHHTTLVLHKYLPTGYEETVELFITLVDKFIQNEYPWLPYMFLPDYIETYGISNYDLSIQAYTRITQFVSCEFAVRPFIIKYGQKMMDQMLQWASHAHPMVRRLATEGCRPRLPWGISLPEFKKDPTPVLIILEKLKNDPDESVRLSVANNLNDIAKDNPQTVIKIARAWHGKNKETDRLVKHGCRTLLKQGQAGILKLFGYNPDSIDVKDLSIIEKNVYMGESVSFTFRIINNATEPRLIRIEYAVYYVKANGKQIPKVFKISERLLQAGEVSAISRNHPFKKITTRKFYPGEHRISLIINGKEALTESFNLKE